MKLDYLHNTNAFGEHIIRLYDFGKQEALQFKQAIEQTIVANKLPLDLSTLSFIAARNCHLVLHLGDEEAGIQTADGKHFICVLTLNGYQQMLQLLQPFCLKDTKGYQWLYDLDTEIDFLFSPAGSW